MFCKIKTRLNATMPPLAADAIGALALMVTLFGGLHLPSMF
ncbi:hypothetical protein [Vannielia sp.]|nr:hypothetical protein [Vannielia sp.]MDF1872582.1 hypothetical protein [Vannielia sp.]